MERLEFRFAARPTNRPTADHVVAGVVSSGNLEVLLEPGAPGSGATAVVETSARGFGPIWEAVLRDFFERHPLGDVTVSINDAGATPAVVGLRLDQAAVAFAGDPR